MKKIIYKSILLILIFPNYSIAQQKDLWTTFTAADGLADNNVADILEASDGALWFATYGGGVSRYQHGSWTTFTTADGLADNDVRVIIEARDGALWFGTDRGVVSRYQHGSWTTFTVDIAPESYFSRMLEASDGSLWFTTFGNGVSRYQYGSWTTLTEAAGLADNRVWDMLESSDGSLWFATYGGVSHYQQGSWTTFTEADGLAENYVRFIFEASDGALWFATYNGGVSRYKQGSWTTFTEADGLAANDDVSFIFESSDGALWFGTAYSGVSRYQEGSWTSFTTADGLASGSVNDILESSDGALWFATNGGVSRYQQGIWTTLTTADGLAGNSVNDILESSDGALWFATYFSGVSRYQQGIWTTFTEADGLAAKNVNFILEASDGSLWFATNGGVSRYQQGIWTIFTEVNGLAGNYVSFILETSDGSLWFAAFGGIIRYRQGIWTTFTDADGLADNFVTGILEASDGSLWFGTDRGVIRYQQGIWTTFTKDDGLAENHITFIFEASDGALWFACTAAYSIHGRDGVSRYQHGIWTTFTEADGLAAKNVSFILEANDGALWFATNGGVSRYQQGIWTSFTEGDGLAGNDVRFILESSDGALWFATIDGVSRYQQGIWTSFTEADGLTENSVRFLFEASDGALWFATYFGGVSILKPDKIPPFTYILKGPTSNSLIGTSPAFYINGYDYQTEPEKLRFLWELSDNNENLIYRDSLNINDIKQIQLNINQNGTFIFKAKAKDLWGNIDQTPATRNFTLDITPPTTVIDSPIRNDTTGQMIPIIGYAYDDSPIKDFDYYSICYGKGLTAKSITKWDTLVLKETTEIRGDTLAEWNAEGHRGTYQLKLFAKDALGHTSQDTISIHIVDVIGEVKSKDGGYLEDLTNNIEIYFPPNALPENTEIKISLVSDLDPETENNDFRRYTNLAYDIMPKSITSKKPGTLSITYHDTNLVNITDERKLSIFRYNDDQKNWVVIGGTVITEHNKITTAINQLGRYGLFEDLSVGNKSSISNIDCQPRVFSPRGNVYNTKTAISFELGKASNVTIKIYNTAGRLIRALTQNEPMTHGIKVIDWDGRDQQGNFCETGLYIVTIQAEDKMESKTVVVLNDI